MTGLGILILIVVFFWLIWPTIARWLKKKAMERAEDYVRSSMGMPPRDKRRKGGNHQNGPYYERERGNSHYNHRGEHGPIIPKEYAEDVEFIETKDYSEKEPIKTAKVKEVYKESQISDAEYIEIKKDRIK